MRSPGKLPRNTADPLNHCTGQRRIKPQDRQSPTRKRPRSFSRRRSTRGLRVRRSPRNEAPWRPGGPRADKTEQNLDSANPCRPCTSRSHRGSFVTPPPASVHRPRPRAGALARVTARSCFGCAPTNSTDRRAQRAWPRALSGEPPIETPRPRMIRGQHLGDCL
jgi:hypothetical protein